MSNTVSLRSEPSLRVKFHDLLGLLENAHEQKKAANDGASPSLPMIAVKHGDPFTICCQKSGYFLTDDEESIKGRSFMILPFKTNHILKLSLLDASATDVDSHVFILM